MPSWTWYVSAIPGAESANKRIVLFQLVEGSASYSAMNGFQWWLADSAYGKITTTTPSTLTHNGSASLVLRTLLARRYYIARTSANGKLSATIGYAGTKTWYICTATVDGNIKSYSVSFA